jgi:hypothetical protein
MLNPFEWIDELGRANEGKTDNEDDCEQDNAAQWPYQQGHSRDHAKHGEEKPLSKSRRPV